MSVALRVFLIGFAALLSAMIPAKAQPVDGGHAVVEIISDHEQATPGQTFRGALKLTIDEKWHVYWRNPGDSGLPPEILWDDLTNVEPGEFAWPAPNPQPLETLMNYGYEDKLVLPFAVTVPSEAGGSVILSGLAQYLICKDICIPEEAQVALMLPVGDVAIPNTVTAIDFAEADSQIPMTFAGEATIDRSGEQWQLSLADPALRAGLDADLKSIRFFPNDHQILHPAEQPIAFGDSGLTMSLTEAPGLGTDGELSGVVVLEDVDANRVAFDVSAQPGAVLAGTADSPLSFGTSSSGAGSAAQLGLTALLGVLASAFIGGAILNLMPCVFPVLFIKANSLTQLAAAGDGPELRRHGLFYLVGVLVCFVGLGVIVAMLRAAGDQVGLGFQLQYPPVVASLALLLFVMGLSMMGMFEFGSSLMGVGNNLASKGGGQGAFFTGVLAAFVGGACVGPFLGSVSGVLVTQPVHIILLVFFTLGLGLGLPFALLSMTPQLVSALPKPGAWMERLKQFFAFPIFLTALWLLWVLGGLAGSNAIVMTALAATVLVFAIWLVQSAPEGGLGRLLSRLGAGAAALIAAVLIIVPGMTGGTAASSSASEVSTSAGYDGDWSTARVAQSREEGRAVFIDFTARWCVTCQVNKRTTLFTDRVQAAFEENNVDFLVADWTRKDNEIADELARFGRAGVPLYVFYPADGGEPRVLPQILTPELVIKALDDDPVV